MNRAEPAAPVSRTLAPVGKFVVLQRFLLILDPQFLVCSLCLGPPCRSSDEGSKPACKSAYSFFICSEYPLRSLQELPNQFGRPSNFGGSAPPFTANRLILCSAGLGCQHGGVTGIRDENRVPDHVALKSWRFRIAFRALLPEQR